LDVTTLGGKNYAGLGSNLGLPQARKTTLKIEGRQKSASTDSKKGNNRKVFANNNSPKGEPKQGAEA